MKPLKSRLALAVTFWGWLLFASWLSYDYAVYQDRWIVHIFEPASNYEIHSFYVLIILVPFVYTFLGYLVNERERLLNEIRKSEENFRSLSLQDELTRLYNRRGFVLLTEQLFRMAARTKKGVLLLFVDVDNLKSINDGLGHLEGDKALIDIADILRKNVREADVLARFGGDEFAAIINDTSKALPETLSMRIREDLEKFNRDSGKSFRLAVSIGFARYEPDSPRTLEELLEQADKDMYRNKADNNSLS